MAFCSLLLVFLAGLVFFSEAAPLGSHDSKHPLIVKILDAVRGSPASSVPIKLYKKADDGTWQLLSSGWYSLLMILVIVIILLLLSSVPFPTQLQL